MIYNLPTLIESTTKATDTQPSIFQKERDMLKKTTSIKKHITVAKSSINPVTTADSNLIAIKIIPTN